MITEEDRERLSLEKVKKAIAFCEESMVKAEKYERLSENKDWQDHLKDLRVLADLHAREITSGSAMLINAPRTGYIKINDAGNQVYVSSKDDWLDFMMRHEIERSEILKWLKEPEAVLSMAQTAREKLPILKKQLAEMTHESHAGNGKS
jgi:hypothetical protein